MSRSGGRERNWLGVAGSPARVGAALGPHVRISQIRVIKRVQKQPWCGAGGAEMRGGYRLQPPIRVDPQLYYHDCSGRIPGHTTRTSPGICNRDVLSKLAMAYWWFHQRMPGGNNEHPPLALYRFDIAGWAIFELLDQRILYFCRF